MDAAPRNQVRRSQQPSKSLLVKHWMSPTLHSIGKEQPLSVAHKLMDDHDLRHLPVLADGKLVGLVSQRDLYYLETVAGVDPERERVEEGMSQDVYCVPPETLLRDVVVEMMMHKYGCAVVVESTKVVGIFTTTDALKLLAECLLRSPPQL
jgi:acetoin utilization protein AcuB